MKHVSPRCFRAFPLWGHTVFEQPSLRKSVPAQINLAKFPSQFCDSMIITGMESHIKGNYLKIQPFVDLYVSFGFYLVHFFQFPFWSPECQITWHVWHKPSQKAANCYTWTKHIEIPRESGQMCCYLFLVTCSKKKSTPCFLAKHSWLICVKCS